MEMIIVCAWCPEHTHYSNSVDNTWKPITTEVLLWVRNNPGKLSHGLCPSCHTSLMAEEEERFIVYCIKDRCTKTRWYDEQVWSESYQRSQAVIEGEPSMMGPYCPEHSNLKREVA